jgi:hypothetical protein
LAKLRTFCSIIFSVIPFTLHKYLRRLNAIVFISPFFAFQSAALKHKNITKMLKIFCVLTIVFSTVYAVNPHHSLAESLDDDVRQFGELIDKIVKLFEKGRKIYKILKFCDFSFCFSIILSKLQKKIGNSDFS